MEILKNSMLNFIQVLDKYPPRGSPCIIVYHDGFINIPFEGGKLRYTSEPLEIHVDERLPISPELDFFYRHCEITCNKCTDIEDFLDIEDIHNIAFKHSRYMTIDVGELFALPHPEAGLAEFQMNWRWRHGSSDEKMKENLDWNPRWLVVAYNILCDAVIVDTGKEKSPVMIASHDDGIPHLVANSFAEFLDYLSILIELEHGKYNGNKWDEEADDNYVEGFIDDAKGRLGNATSDDRQVENLINYLYRRDLIGN